jgi:galactokinase
VETLYNLTNIKPVDKALRCQKSEHDFAGMPCGIMDQYISTLGEQGNLLLIDCRSNEFQLVPFGKTAVSPTTGEGKGKGKKNTTSATESKSSAGESDEDDVIILVTNSNVKHQLTGSEYPDRVKQCKEAVKALQKKFPSANIKSLRDATIEQLEKVHSDSSSGLSDVAYKRGKHVIKENQRTLDTVEALKKKDWMTVGERMNESHVSLRDDYEVSCEEIDFLVRTAISCTGVYGSRITGGGFGGCTVTLLKKKDVKEVEKFLQESYWKQYHKKCDCYEAIPSNGTRQIIDFASYLSSAMDSFAGEKSNKVGNPEGKSGKENACFDLTKGFCNPFSGMCSGNGCPSSFFSPHYIVPTVAIVSVITLAVLHSMRNKR